MSTTTYLITGANRGIGLQIVKLLAARPGAKIIATTRSDAKDLTELAVKTGKITILKLSVGDPDSISAFGEELSKLPNLSIDYFISNAAVFNALGSAVETPRQAWIDHWTVNTLGPIEVLKVVKPHLAPKNNLIFVSTIGASISMLTEFPLSLSAYGASKAGLNYIVKELSIELKDSIVVAIHPGVVSTEMGHFAFGAAKEALGFVPPSITPEVSAESQLKVIDNLKPEQSGRFLVYDGTELGW